MKLIKLLFVDWHRYLLPVFVCFRLVFFVSDASLVMAASRMENPSLVSGNSIDRYFTQPFAQEDFLALTNEARVARNLPALRLNSELAMAAVAKAEDMALKGYWEHFRPSDHKAPWAFIKEAGYDYAVAGENLARGFKTPAGITKAWLASPSHKANILSSKYNEVGFACIESTDKEGNRVLLTVQMFGGR